MYQLTDRDFSRVADILRQKKRIDLGGYRRTLIANRLQARMQFLKYEQMDDYLQLLAQSADEAEVLINEIGINVTSFYRDPLLFEFLEHDLIPKLVEHKKKEHSTALRIWCAGCASGDEAYSLAILLKEWLATQHCPLEPVIFATDVDSDALAKAESGIYAQTHLENIKLGLFLKYFTPTDNEQFQLSPEIIDMVHFSFHDLTTTETRCPAESIYGEFDLILCRNVLIYFSEHMQSNVLHRLESVLVPGGILVLGLYESIADLDPYSLFAENRSLHIFRKLLGSNRAG